MEGVEVGGAGVGGAEVGGAEGGGAEVEVPGGNHHSGGVAITMGVWPLQYMSIAITECFLPLQCEHYYYP